MYVCIYTYTGCVEHTWRFLRFVKTRMPAKRRFHTERHHVQWRLEFSWMARCSVRQSTGVVDLCIKRQSVTAAQRRGRHSFKDTLLLATGWTQKPSLISSSYKNQNLLGYFYKYGTADTLTQEIFNFPARRQKAVKCKMALNSQQRSWCVLEFHKTNSVVIVQRAFKHKFNVDPPTNKSISKWHKNFIERGCICDQRKGHSCKNIPVGFDFITTLNQGVFLCSSCTLLSWVSMWRQEGSVKDSKPRGRPLSARTTDNVERVIVAMLRSPPGSVRQQDLALRFNCAQGFALPSTHNPSCSRS